jgi:UDP-N-acetyl-D-mannosaminuronate dehydrogenase
VGTKQNVVVVGLGEVGKPLFEILSEHHHTVGVDLPLPARLPQNVDVLHICFPYEITDFVGAVARYIELFNPKLTVINSTVGIGTTRAVAVKTGAAVVNSPVRGKHIRMREELKKYVKFIGALRPEDGSLAAEHFEQAGVKTKVLSAPEATELAKLTETTYFGVMIAWAQEIERYCDQANQKYEEITSFYDEIKFFPSVKYFPGVIGGHCVMPNIEILSKFQPSEILDAVRSSNRAKMDRDARLNSTKDAAKADSNLAVTRNS